MVYPFWEAGGRGPYPKSGPTAQDPNCRATRPAGTGLLAARNGATAALILTSRASCEAPYQGCSAERCHLVRDLRNDSRKLAPHRRYPFIATLIDLRSGDPRAEMHRPQACSRLRPDQAAADTPDMDLRIGTARALGHGFELAGQVKTGYTEASGYNSVSSVRRNEKHIVAAVLGVLHCAR